MYTELACQGVFYSKLHSTRCTCTCTRYSGSTRIFRVFICTLKYGCRHFSGIYLYIRLYPEVLVPSGTSLYSLRVQRSTSTCTCTFYLYMYFEVQLYNHVLSSTKFCRLTCTCTYDRHIRTYTNKRCLYISISVYIKLYLKAPVKAGVQIVDTSIF